MSLLCLPLRYSPSGIRNNAIIQFDRKKTVKDLKDRISQISHININDFEIFLDLSEDVWKEGELVQCKGAELIPILDDTLTLDKVGFKNEENFYILVEIKEAIAHLLQLNNNVKIKQKFEELSYDTDLFF